MVLYPRSIIEWFSLSHDEISQSNAIHLLFELGDHTWAIFLFSAYSLKFSIVGYFCDIEVTYSTLDRPGIELRILCQDDSVIFIIIILIQWRIYLPSLASMFSKVALNPIYSFIHLFIHLRVELTFCLLITV